MGGNYYAPRGSQQGGYSPFGYGGGFYWYSLSPILIIFIYFISILTNIYQNIFFYKNSTKISFQALLLSKL
jgi:hypothetical protein